MRPRVGKYYNRFSGQVKIIAQCASVCRVLSCSKKRLIFPQSESDACNLFTDDPKLFYIELGIDSVIPWSINYLCTIPDESKEKNN